MTWWTRMVSNLRLSLLSFILILPAWLWRKLFRNSWKKSRTRTKDSLYCLLNDSLFLWRRKKLHSFAPDSLFTFEPSIHRLSLRVLLFSSLGPSFTRRTPLPWVETQKKKSIRLRRIKPFPPDIQLCTHYPFPLLRPRSVIPQQLASNNTSPCWTRLVSQYHKRLYKEPFVHQWIEGEKLMVIQLGFRTRRRILFKLELHQTAYVKEWMKEESWAPVSYN